MLAELVPALVSILFLMLVAFVAGLHIGRCLERGSC